MRRMNQLMGVMSFRLLQSVGNEPYETTIIIIFNNTAIMGNPAFNAQGCKEWYGSYTGIFYNTPSYPQYEEVKQKWEN